MSPPRHAVAAPTGRGPGGAGAGAPASSVEIPSGKLPSGDLTSPRKMDHLKVIYPIQIAIFQSLAMLTYHRVTQPLDMAVESS